MTRKERDNRKTNRGMGECLPTPGKDGLLDHKEKKQYHSLWRHAPSSTLENYFGNSSNASILHLSVYNLF